MTGPSPAELLRHLGDASPDGELLARFVHHRDQVAFAQLVRRHGPVVLGVCRKVAGHPQDAEDAFQAVFLVLARKAASVANPDLLGNWLYGVAVRVARRARRAASRRRAREVQVVTMPDPAATESCSPPDIGPVLHDELSQLPACFRDAIVLCDLRGVTRSEAAAALGIPEGTLSSRLANGRKKLAERLTRRGVTLSVAALPAVVAEGVAAVPERLIVGTCGLVADWAAGATVAAPVSRLAAGGFDVKKLLVVGVCTAVLAAAGVVFAGRPDPVPDPPKPQPAQAANPIELAAEQKAEPKPTPFTTRPRMQHAVDLPIQSVTKIVWSPDGKRLAVVGTPYREDKHERIPGSILVWGGGFNWVFQPATEVLVGFKPDSTHLVTEMREHNLISGRHFLHIWEEVPAPAPPAGGAGGAAPGWNSRVQLELEPEMTGFAFSPDGRRFWTVSRELVRPGVFGGVEVREVSAWTGETWKTVRKIDGEYTGFHLSPDRRYLALTDAANHTTTVWNLDKGTKATPKWSPVARPAPDAGGGSPPNKPRDQQGFRLRFSQDSRLFFAARDGAMPAVFDSETGAVVAPLADLRFYGLTADQCFSTDGRLLVTRGYGRTSPDPDSSNRFLVQVWETSTGRLLKTWDRQVRAVAFRPKTLTLAILEGNVDATRLGLWDFAASDK